MTAWIYRWDEQKGTCDLHETIEGVRTFRITRREIIVYTTQKRLTFPLKEYVASVEPSH